MAICLESFVRLRDAFNTEKEIWMNKVFAVQELKRYHCPKCDGTYSDFNRATNEQTCRQCSHVYPSSAGIPKPVHSLTEAAVYGDIEVLIATNHVGIALQPLIASMKNKLRNFDDDDYLLPVGDPVAIGIATTIAAAYNRGRVNFLRWDRQTRSYIKIKVEMK